MSEQAAYLVLNAIAGLGPASIKGLVEFFGSAQQVLGQDEGALIASGIVDPKIAQNIVHFLKDKFLENEYNLMQQKGAQVLTWVDEGFPLLLREIPGAPVVLYVQGDPSVLHAASIAMVGSRNASHYGMSVTRNFARRFAESGLIVVSGLARGIDTAAHRGCLEQKGKTIAVLAGGLNHVYPKENLRLAEEIVNNGALVSEMPMSVQPLPVWFPRRNRIVTGLTTMTVVVEAGEKSGALISAGYALEQGKDVFAVPANIDNVCAVGSNRLIKDGARVALTADDVLEEFKGQMNISFPSGQARSESRVALTEPEMKALTALSLEPVHVDQLSAQVCQPLADIAQVLFNLELKGVVRQLPGKMYVRNEALL